MTGIRIHSLQPLYAIKKRAQLFNLVVQVRHVDRQVRLPILELERLFELLFHVEELLLDSLWGVVGAMRKHLIFDSGAVFASPMADTVGFILFNPK